MASHTLSNRTILVTGASPRVTTGVLGAGSASRPIFAEYDGSRVAELIVKIADSASPHMRYGVGVNAIMLPLLKTQLPQRLFDTALRRSYRLPGRQDFD